jgi:serine protease Do
LDGISPQEASDLGLESPRGARVVAVPRETPEAKAGLVPGDVILRFNEIDIHDINHLINVVSMTPIGRASRIQIWRDRKPLTLEIMVADRETIAPTRVGGAVVGAPSAGPLRRAPRPGQMNGLDVVAITSEEQAKRYDLPIDARGVLVLRVNPRSPLSAWLKSGDVVESYTGASEAPKSFADIETAEKQFAHDQPFDLIIRRRTPEGYIPLTIRTR